MTFYGDSPGISIIFGTFFFNAISFVRLGVGDFGGPAYFCSKVNEIVKVLCSNVVKI
jgi:hypothetical protein